MNRMIVFVLLLVLCVPAVVSAQMPEQLVSDFSPLDGYIIMPVGDEYLIDLDAAKGLRQGDLLALVEPGEKVIHPVTKEVLGTLDQARGFLQVTRMKAGYSYARLLSSGVTPVKGEPVRRFEQVPAGFGPILAARALADQLRAALPHLEWQADPAEMTPLLTFALAGNRLQVTDREGTVLKSYPVVLQSSALIAPSPEPEEAVVPAPAAPEPFSPAAGPVGIPTAGIAAGGAAQPATKSTAIIRQAEQGGVWMGPNLPGNQVGVAVADFDGDGRQESAVATEDVLLIYEIVAGQMTEEAKIDFARGIRLMSADVIDIDADGLPEIYLSAASGNTLSSQVVAFNQGEYRNIRTDIPWFLRVAELPGEGRVLLGQAAGQGEDPYSEPLFRVRLTGAELVKGETLELPALVNVFGVLPFAGKKGDQLYAYLSKGDYLYVINAAGEQLWESSDYFGGTETLFYSQNPTGNELVEPFYVQQRLIPGAGGTILAVQNEGKRTLQRFRLFKKSRIVALDWNGYAMQERWRTADQEGFLVDFGLADADNDGQDELVSLVQFQRKNLIRKGRATLVLYELTP